MLHLGTLLWSGKHLPLFVLGNLPAKGELYLSAH